MLTGVNLNQYAERVDVSNGTAITSVCSSFRLSRRSSALFKLRRRGTGNSPTETRLDHGDLLLMGGLTHSEYEHSAASELVGPQDISAHQVLPTSRFHWLCPTFRCAKFD